MKRGCLDAITYDNKRNGIIISFSSTGNPDKIITAVKRGHQVLDFFH